MASNFLCNIAKWLRADNATNPTPVCPKNPYRIYELEEIRNGFRDSIDPMIQGQMGICGTPVILNAGSPKTAAGVFYCQIQVITDTVFTVTAGNTQMTDGTGAAIDMSALSAITVKAGTTLLGNWTTIDLTSGVVIAYPHPFLP